MTTPESSDRNTELICYKEIGDTRLYLERYPAEGMPVAKPTPAMVFFFGGGWSGGDRNHLSRQAAYFAARGLTCFCADYRTKGSHDVPPFECLKDARAAIRFVRANAERLGIDPTRLIGSGGSAGGHLAAAAALVEGYDHGDDDLSVSCKPDALVLFNPVIDNGPGGYGYPRVGEAYKDFSPLHNIRKGAPPTVLFLGTEDEGIPVATMRYYQTVMERVGSRCELHLYEGRPHGFFNYDRTPDHRDFKDTLEKADRFLVSLGYLGDKPRAEL